VQDTPISRAETKGSAGKADSTRHVPARRPLLLVALAAAAALWWWLQVPQVASTTVMRGDAAEVVYATGTVEPRHWAKVSALIRKRIVEMCDCEGKPVSKGDVLARLDDQEEKAVLSELQARRDRFMEDANRLKGLVERNIASRVAYDDKLTQIREYDARIAAQKDRIADLELRSPVDGVVLRRDGQVGEIAGTTNADVLFWVGQPRPLRIVAEVNEEDIAKVREGQKVLLRHEGFRGAVLEASIGEITPKGDPTTKTFRVFFALPDDTPLKIGMSIEANIVVREAKGVLLLPADAIRDGHVLAVEGGRIKRIPVVTGIKGTRMVEIVSGLAPERAVVTPFRADLSNGARVSATPAKAP
jgi:membrane fusion protein (multidrug efflux system)